MLLTRRHAEDLRGVAAARRAVQDAAAVHGGHDGGGDQRGHGEVRAGEGRPRKVLSAGGKPCVLVLTVLVCLKPMSSVLP